MIGVDWGTSNFRAVRLRQGQVAARIGSGPGLLQVPEGGFGAALRDAIGGWLAEGADRVLLSGMVGSRQGWVEAPYLPCPADLSALADACVAVPFDGASVRIVPGLSALDPAGTPEVMRGEEVQLLGALHETGPDALVCLPGTHSKWARIEGGRIAGFTTHMTGEVFATLKQHTILGRLMEDGAAAGAEFARGVERAREDGGLLHHLFGVRSLGLFERLAAGGAESYLSGLLIGHEIAAARPQGVVHLIGAGALCALYAAALAQHGVEARIVGADAAAMGLMRIGEQVAWG